AIVPWRSLAATAHHHLGSRPEARRLAAEEVDLAQGFGAPRSLGVALRVQGLVEGGSRGIEILETAVNVLAASPARLEHARALSEFGTALRQAGRREAATVLREGLEAAERCGSIALSDHLQKELRATGARPPRRSRRDPAS